jgi:hypothetical protein
MTRGGPWPHVGLAAAAIAAAAVISDPAPTVEEVFSFADREIDESSGLAVQDGLVLTVNDSGDDAVVYAVDPGTGETVGRTTYSADEVEDVEALAIGPDGTVWVADIGDNAAERSSVAVYAVPPVVEGDRTVEASRYELTYRDGAHNAETLLADPRDGRLYVVTKELLGGGDVFAAPRRLDEDQPNVLEKVAPAKGVLTDGAFTADGRHALLRGYGRVWLTDAGGWRTLASMPLPAQRQGEGIAVTDDPESFLLSSEGARTPVLTVPMDEELRDAQTSDGAASPAVGSDEVGAAGDASQQDAADQPGVFHLHGRALKLAAALLVAVALGVAAGARFLRGGRRRSRWTR